MSLLNSGIGGRTTRASSVGRPERMYPSPYFDITNNFQPRSLKETFQWCDFYSSMNPIIATLVSKLAAYPITELVYNSANEASSNTWSRFFERTLGLRAFLVESNLDRYTYGNSFTSVYFPFIKHLQCPNCGHSRPLKAPANKKQPRIQYRWRGYRFHADCPKCDYEGAHKAVDKPDRRASGIRLLRWNPRDITIRKNTLTGEVRYIYDMPRHLRNQIKLGKPDVIETVPQEFIDAQRRKKLILIDKMFHSKRPAPSKFSGEAGWGTPLMLPVLKDSFFVQVLRKAQEAVALEHIVPMRVLFPQSTTDANNVFANVNVREWQGETTSQVNKWKQDPNHIPVLPFPLGYQLIGGQGRGMLMHQDLRLCYEQIISGMGVPVSFFYGDAHYSGASVNMRGLENEFLGHRADMLKLVFFIADEVQHFMSWPDVSLEFRPFKMADDLQRASFDLNLYNQQLISGRTLCQRQSIDFDNEQKQINEEQKQLNMRNRDASLVQAETQGESQLIQARYGVKAMEIQNAGMPQQPTEGGEEGQQGVPTEAGPQQGQPPQQPVGAAQAQPQPGSSIEEMMAWADRTAPFINRMTAVDQFAALNRIKSEYGQAAHDMVAQRVKKGGGTFEAPPPLPEQRPSTAAPDLQQL
jgi:hypothetical protein